VHTPTGHAETSTYSGYLLMSTYDSTTKRSTTYSYNGFSRVQTVTGNGGATKVDFYYNRPYQGAGDFGLLDSVYVGNTGTHASPSGGFLAAWHQYNAWGQDSIITDGAGHKTTFLYSDTTHYSNPVQVTDPLNRVVTKAHYDSVGRPDTTWAPSNGSYAATVLTYDQLNRTRAVKDPLGFTTQYVYGPIILNQVIDAKGKSYRFDYNALGWMTMQHDLADITKADTLKYDVGGRVRTVGTRRGDAISLTVDAVGRVLTRAGPDFPTDSFRYDPAGRWMVAVNANAYDSVAYDVAGRLTYSLERLTGDSSYVMSFTYDTLGRVKTRSAPRGGSAMTFGYNPGRGTLDTVCAGGQCSVWASRDADNIAHVLGYAVSNSQHFQLNMYTDSAHRIVSDSFAGPTTYAPQLDTTFSKAWTYDSLGRVTDEWPYGSTYGAGGFRYAYDGDGRLTLACLDQTRFIYPPGELDPRCIDEYGRSTGWGFSTQNPYHYDSTGNRVDSAAAAVIGPGNRVTQFKGYVLSYDPNGNIVSKKGLGGSLPTDTTLFTWDAASRLKHVERWTGAGAHTIIVYAYDALGRRVAKTVGSTTERYVHDGDQVIEDIDGATHALKAEYTWVPGALDKLLYIRTTGWTAGVITDPLNSSVRGFANLSNGQPMKQYPASYWGEVSADTGFVVGSGTRDASTMPRPASTITARATTIRRSGGFSQRTRKG
jgi:YD repeat-containing protein